MGLIALALTMAYQSKVNYADTFGTTSIWDSIIYNQLIKKNVIIPPKPPLDHDVSRIVGGYVKEPQVGSHNWVTSFDLASLYPNIIVQYNMSPETMCYDEDIPTAIAANGASFSTVRLLISTSVTSISVSPRVLLCLVNVLSR